MTRAELDALCGAMPGAVPAGPDAYDGWTINGRIFVSFGGPGAGSRLSVRTPDAATAAMLIEMGVAVRAPSFSAAWVRLFFNGLTHAEAAHRIAVSYDTVRASLPTAVQEAL